MTKLQDLKINRELKPGTYNFKELCDGIEKIAAVKKIFGKDAEKVLANLKVRISKSQGYAYIDDSKGILVLSLEYLKNGKEEYLHLDLMHELVHIRQLGEGKELFDNRYEYVDRPTEIEAYKIAAKQALKMGFKGKRLRDYLEVDWLPKKESERLLKNIGIK